MSVRDTVVTEFILTEKGASAVISKMNAVGTAAVKSQKQAATPYQGAIPPKIGVARLDQSNGYTGSIPPVVKAATAKANENVASAMDGLASSLTGGLSGMASAIHPVVGAIVGAFTAAATAVVGILSYVTSKGMAAANNKDQLERMLGDAQGGDLGKGKAVYKDIAGRYAKTSNFGTDVNAEQAMKLIGAGMDWDKWLKNAEKFSQGRAEKLDQMVGAITRINSGGLGEGAESLRDLGIGRKQLEAEGLKYNKGGGIESTAEEFLKVIERLSAKRGNLSGQGNNARIGNVEDVITQAWAAFGGVIQNSVLPLMEKFGDGIQSLVDSGAIEGLGDSFNGLMDSIVGDSADGLGDLFFELAVQSAILIDNFSLVASGMRKGLDILSKIPGVGIGFGAAGAVSSMFNDHTGRREAMENIRRMRQDQRDRDEAKQAREKSDEPMNKVESKLDAIVTHTKRSADAAEKDLGERLLGGGSFTKQAFSAISQQGGSGSEIKAQLVKLGDLIEDALAQQSRNGARGYA